MTEKALPKRKPHRGAASKLLSPTGARRTGSAMARQCCMCRSVRSQGQLLQLGPIPDAAGEQPKAHRARGRHSYVCVAQACLRQAALRMAGKKSEPKVALAAFLAPLTQLAITRLTETLGLARRQGLLVMGASRLIALRPKEDVFMDHDGDDDDDSDDDDHGDGDGVIEVDFVDRHHGPRGKPTDTVVGGGREANADVFAPKQPDGEQDVILLAADAAPRTARRLGPAALPCMLSGADMGHAAGGAPVAAVGIPAGRLALQAAYWLQVWYEAQRVLTTPESIA